MKDIAMKTGYSINTVSHALNNNDDVQPSTRKFIQKVAKDIGYIGNMAAGSLRSGYTKTVAIIISDISNPFFSLMVKQIEEELRGRQYTTLIMNTEENPNDEMNAVIVSIRKGVDGIIICPTQQNNLAIDIMKKNEIPFVLLGRYFEGHRYESVICDDVQCGYLATKHLLELGHRKILFVNGPSHISSSKERQAGYIKALIEFEVPVDERMIRIVDLVENDCSKVLDDIIQGQTDTTAIFAFNDILAWGIIDCLCKAGLRVPEDYSIVSVDNLQSHFRIPVGLTSVDMAKTQMAGLLVSSLHRLIHEGFTATAKQVLTPELIVRDTTRKLL